MEPTRDTTIERLMKGKARFLNPGKTSQRASLTLINKARGINAMLDRMNRAESIPAPELAAALDELHAALFELVDQIHYDVEVIV